MGLFTGDTPSITPEDTVGLVGGVLSLAAAFGLHLTGAQQHAILAFVALLAAFVVGAAHRRNGRAQGVGVAQVNAVAGSAALMSNPSVDLSSATPEPVDHTAPAAGEVVEDYTAGGKS